MARNPFRRGRSTGSGRARMRTVSRSSKPARNENARPRPHSPWLRFRRQARTKLGLRSPAVRAARANYVATRVAARARAATLAASKAKSASPVRLAQRILAQRQMMLRNGVPAKSPQRLARIAAAKRGLRTRQVNAAARAAFKAASRAKARSRGKATSRSSGRGDSSTTGSK